MRKIVLSLFLLLLVGQLSAAKHMVTGRVANRDNGELLEMAALRLFSYTNGDSLLITGAQTNQNGEFALEANIGHAQGKYALIVSMLGYKEKKVEVVFSRREVNMKTISIEEETQELGVVEVRGTAAEMVVRGDTVEYNASAYKMNENAVVEDLLKKMSGVEVSSDGKVTINGEEIKGVRIDGKKFFGSDVQTATKNIPVEMIDKIQVIDQKSDMAKMTGIEDEDTERIINLSLKSNRKRGIFGNYTLGAGADISPAFRYTGNLFTNFMLGESQTTLLGSAANTNEQRTGRGRGGASGGQGEGITRAENVGVNTNIDFTSRLRNPRQGASLLFGGDASFTHSHTDKYTLKDKTLYSSDFTYHNLDSSYALTGAWNASARLELEYKADDKNKLIIKPDISYTNSESTGWNSYLYHRADAVIRDGRQAQYGRNDNIQASLQVLYSHGFAKPGRLFSLDGRVSLTDTHGNSTTQAWNNLLALSDVDQHVHTASNALSYSLKTSWVEPIYGREHFLETALTFKGNHRTSEKTQESADTVSASETFGQYVYDPVYSNRMLTDFFQEVLELNYRLTRTEYDLTLGAQFNPSQTHSVSYYGETLARDTLIASYNWSPNASLKFKFGKRDFLRLRYRGQSSQPSVSQMEPVRNNSNSMAESVGNLGLNPAFSHSFMLSYSKYNQTRMSSVMTGLRANLTQDALVENSIYDRTGKRYSQTVNAEALPWSVSGDLMYNTPFANKLMQFHSRTSLSYNQRVAYVLREQETALIEEMIARDAFVRGLASYTGNLQAAEDINLRLTYNWLDLGVNAQATYNRTANSLTHNLSHTIRWTVKGDLTFRLPKSWNISADCAYTSRWGYQLSDVNEVLLNARVDKTWGDATLALEAKDLLHQRKNIVQVVSADAVTYQKFNTLPTYVMLTFTYKLNRMGDLRAKGAAGFMQDAIESGQKGPGVPPPPMGL